MINHKQLFAVSLCITLLEAVAGSARADDVEYAQRSDLVGIWEGVEIAEQAQPKLLPSAPWPLKCQWFAFFEDGRYATFMRSANPDGKCGPVDGKAIASSFEKAPASMFFKWVAGKDGGKGLVFVGSNENKNYIEVWAPHIFKVDADVRGEAYRKGDLFLRLLSPKNFTDTLWLRHLRRVDAQPGVAGDAAPEGGAAPLN